MLRGALPSSGGGGQEAIAAADARKRDAQQQGTLRVLTWGGIGRATVSWCPRYATVYQASQGVGGVLTCGGVSAPAC